MMCWKTQPLNRKASRKLDGHFKVWKNEQKPEVQLEKWFLVVKW